ncbi:VOC family protein [Propioniciclava coleopterorum]|uniref:VOC family protein n=1 Tax=Propioniciclava coleopterorum TaxID=2714937 RepID=A0A6G7Y4C6_9ACTN|nr:VOC family protein [Propioniciclava coleopterorum]QIK71516.1 VOC family protein [Propioniciclava coleopterorum]
MQRIVPNIWFDHTAAEAVEFYVSVLPDAAVVETVRYPTEGLPDFQRELAGDVLTVEFEVAGYRMIAINAGPEFEVNTSVSFMLNFDPSVDPSAVERLDAVWDALLADGEAVLPLRAYPFSARYGWVRDRYGVSWQLILADSEGGGVPAVLPTLTFADGVQNRAREALEFYAEVFGGRVQTLVPYGEQVGPAAPEALQFGDLQLFDQWFAAMDSGVASDVTFNCGVSLMVNCHGQEELDRWWSQLSAVPEAEQCGWCADRFGVSWQLVPDNLGELMAAPGAYDTLMGMKKIEIAGFGAPGAV